MVILLIGAYSSISLYVISMSCLKIRLDELEMGVLLSTLEVVSKFWYFHLFLYLSAKYFSSLSMDSILLLPIHANVDYGDRYFKAFAILRATHIVFSDDSIVFLELVSVLDGSIYFLCYVVFLVLVWGLHLLCLHLFVQTLLARKLSLFGTGVLFHCG